VRSSPGGGDGQDPVAGTVHALVAAGCCSGFLFLLRRGGGEGQVVRNPLVAVVAAALVALAVGPFWGGFTPRPPLGQLGWLVVVTLVGQVVGWLLIAFASPRLRSEVGAALLLLTPVGALALAAVALGERPTGPQLVGCGLVLASASAASVRRTVRRQGPRRRRPPTAAPGTSRRSSPRPR
jgi:drug/metabolite transporter (DMT)-like permease